MKKGVIDIGNTRNKAGLFNEKGELELIETFDSANAAALWLSQLGAKKIFVSDVKGVEIEEAEGIFIQYLNATTKLPFKNLYKTPNTLGTDRIAAMAAVAQLYLNEASLVFDIGSCMTIDLLEPDGSYFGGNISPGLKMRLKAMQHFTGKLPISSLDSLHLPMGNSTLSALANGALTGLKYEIEGYIETTLTRFPKANIILCGGDAHYFEKQLKYRIFANHNLVLLGLYQLLIIND
ncbi:MAG: type III pantothenate kinase [bacterium]|nr:type III pantothenate kinase [bacterium]